MSRQLREAVTPLLERIGASVVDLGEVRDGDVVLRWEGEPALAVRLARPASGQGGVEAVGTADLGSLLAVLSAELGGPLKDLPREEKQRAVRLLEDRGAFSYRKSVETVAEELGVTRFTVYNYLNRARA